MISCENCVRITVGSKCTIPKPEFKIEIQNSLPLMKMSIYLNILTLYELNAFENVCENCLLGPPILTLYTFEREGINNYNYSQLLFNNPNVVI